MGVVETAKSYVGKVRYSFGADNIPGGVGDCSSFIQFVFAKNGMTIGRTTSEQVTKGVEVEKGKLISGDLVFFQGTYRAGVSHVGLYIGGGKFCHNSSKRGVVISDLSSSSYVQHWMQGRRIPGASNGSSDNASMGTGRTENKENQTYAKSTLKYMKDVKKKHGKKESKPVDLGVFTTKQIQSESFQVMIHHGNMEFIPAVESDLKIEWERTGTPGRMTFSCIADKNMKADHGDAVYFVWNKNNMFSGYIFDKSYTSKSEVQITCYDQLRYLKNKDTIVYKNKTATELIQMLAKQFGLKTGVLADTIYKIKERAEDGQSLFDMILFALGETTRTKNQIYVLYDDFGKLTLRNIGEMKLKLLIDEETAQSYTYESSINGDTYNQVKLSYSNDETEKREIYIVKDSSTIGKWGMLQYYENVNTDIEIKSRAEALLKYYNHKTRKLSINDVFGDIRVRAGSLIPIILDLGDHKMANFMLVEKVTHKFAQGHRMDLVLSGGGEFIV